MDILVLQINSKLGAMEENIEHALDLIDYAIEAEGEPDLVVLPPFYLSGSPLGGMAASGPFQAALERAHNTFAQLVKVPVVTASYVSDYIDELGGSPVAAEEICLFQDGEMTVLEGEHDDLYDLAGVSVGEHDVAIMIGEPALLLDEAPEAAALINLADDAYDLMRDDIVSGDKLSDDAEYARQSGSWLIRAARVGAQDSAVFPGGSYLISPDGELATESVLFDEAILRVQIPEDGGEWTASLEEVDDRDYGFSMRMDEEGIDDEAADWGAICSGTRDYILKNGFSDVVIGLSGGLDSSIVAAVAADAIGGEHVHGVLMPSVYSSKGSVDDSVELAENLGIETLTIPITGPFEAFEQELAGPCGGAVEGLTRENLQARIRTVYVMALTNQYGWVMLNTGNKSEAAMGYSTLYGDTCGAYAPVGNVYKTRLYELAEWRNAQGDAIPQNVLDKAPSAELRPDQTDQDTLPPYEVIDGICSLYLEYGFSADAIVEEGFEPAVVDRVLGLVTRNEYKRANEPLGPWIDGVSLSDERRWPITNAYRDQTTPQE